MSGETDLQVMLDELEPVVREGEFVFVTVDTVPADVTPEATVLESEGLTLVVPRGVADAHGWQYDFAAGWVTLTIHSALDAVGLTAAVSRALADAGISANMLAGRFHDHVLVPVERRDEAVAVLRDLSARSGRPPRA